MYTQYMYLIIMLIDHAHLDAYYINLVHHSLATFGETVLAQFSTENL